MIHPEKEILSAFNLIRNCAKLISAKPNNNVHKVQIVMPLGTKTK
jgi:hypothetical protein